MFYKGDIVTIKESFRNPGETNQLYRVVDVNSATKRCYIELANCNLSLSPQELVSFDMIHLHRAAPTKVHYNDLNALEDESGTVYTNVSDSAYLMSQSTGELFRVCSLDKQEKPAEIEPLNQYLREMEAEVLAIYRLVDEAKITNTANVSVQWDSYGIAVDFNYSYSDTLGVQDSLLCFAETYNDGQPDAVIWEDAKLIGKELAKNYRLTLEISKDENFLKSISSKNSSLKDLIQSASSRTVKSPHKSFEKDHLPTPTR